MDLNLHDMMELKLGSRPTMKCWAIKGYDYVLPHCFCECWDASNSVVLLSKGLVVANAMYYFGNLFRFLTPFFLP